MVLVHNNRKLIASVHVKTKQYKHESNELYTIFWDHYSVLNSFAQFRVLVNQRLIALQHSPQLLLYL